MSKGCVVSTFDMINIADLDLLRQASEKVDTIGVRVLSDDLVQRLHGRPAVVPQDERLELVRSLRVTDDVRLVNELEELGERPLFSDEDALSDITDAVISPRRSASAELQQALAPVGHLVTRDDDSTVGASA